MPPEPRTPRNRASSRRASTPRHCGPLLRGNTASERRSHGGSCHAPVSQVTGCSAFARDLQRIDADSNRDGPFVLGIGPNRGGTPGRSFRRRTNRTGADRTSASAKTPGNSRYRRAAAGAGGVRRLRIAARNRSGCTSCRPAGQYEKNPEKTVLTSAVFSFFHTLVCIPSRAVESRDGTGARPARKPKPTMGES